MIDLIEKAMNARIALLTGEIQYEGRAYTPRSGVPYTTAKLQHNRMPLGLGPDTPHMWQGVLNLVAVSPAAEGKPAATKRGLLLLLHFPRGLTLVEGAARVVVETTDFQGAYTTGDWIHAPISVRWFCEEPYTP